MPDRGPITKCAIRGCPCLGYFAAWDNRCPLHREPIYDGSVGTPQQTEANDDQ